MNWSLFIANVAAFGFLILAFRLVHKEKYAAFWYVCLISTGLFLCGQAWFQGFVKTWVVSNVNSKLKGLGDQVEQVEKATQETHEQLASHQKQIEGHQKELTGVQE